MWLERCRDGSYAINALRCDVWVVCARIAVGIVTCFIGFWGSVFWWKCIPTSLVFALFNIIISVSQSSVEISAVTGFGLIKCD